MADKWQKEVLEEIKGKESSIKKISGVRNGYVTVTMSNGDVLNCHQRQIGPYEEGTVITYDIEKATMFVFGEPDKSFGVNNMTNIKAKNEASSIQALTGINLTDIVFFDIETVRNEKKLYKKHEIEYNAFRDTIKNRPDVDIDNDKFVKKFYEQKAALMSPFSRVVCISFGAFKKNGEFKTVSYYGEDELEVLAQFSEILYSLNRSSKKYRLCGQNIKKFDIPYLMQRYLINGLPVPNMLDVADKKPWDITCLDTKELFKGSGYYNYSLSTICHCLGIPTPKDGEVTGAGVGDAFFDGKLLEIAEYCEKDVFATANVVLRLMGQDIVDIFTSNLYAYEEEE